MCSQCLIPALVPISLSLFSSLGKPCSSVYITVSTGIPASSPGFYSKLKGGRVIVLSSTIVLECDGGGERACQGLQQHTGVHRDLLALNLWREVGRRELEAVSVEGEHTRNQQ